MKLYGFVIAAISLATAGRCASAAPVKTAHAEIELVPEVRSVTPGEPFWIAVNIKLAPGWHTYWKNPGDAGMAPSVAWELPKGITASAFQWPYPQRLVDEGIVTFGYGGEVAFLARIVPAAGVPMGDTLPIKAKVSLLVCKDICVPEGAEAEVDLPVRAGTSATDPAAAQLFKETRSRIPVKDEAWRMSARADLDHHTIELRVTPSGPATNGIRDAIFFPEPRNIFDYATGSEWDRNGKTYVLKLPVSPASGPLPERLTGVLFSKGGWYGPGIVPALEVDAKFEK